MESNLLDKMLTDYQNRNVPVSIVLQNKVSLAGRIRTFDSYVIILEGQKNEVVYRHAVSCIFPAAEREQKKVPLPRSEPARKPAATTQPPAAPAARPKTEKHAPRPPAALPETRLNTGMKEGLLRWMQERKATK